jgi:hypothetical protein
VNGTCLDLPRVHCRGAVTFWGEVLAPCGMPPVFVRRKRSYGPVSPGAPTPWAQRLGNRIFLVHRPNPGDWDACMRDVAALQAAAGATTTTTRGGEIVNTQ